MKLHVGCGSKYIEGFIHVDLQELKHIDYNVSVDNLNFAKEGSADLVYACHVLEHFGRNEYMNVLKEWYRVLKKGGVLRISVPNFEAVTSYYTQKEKNLEKLLGLLVGGQKIGQYDYHKMIFDEDLLKKALLEIGFSTINRYDWRETEHTNIDDYSQAYLPHMDKENGMLMSLNLEARK